MINFSQQLTVEVLDFTSNDEMLTQQIPKLGREKRRSNLQIWESQDFIAIHSYWLTWDHLLRSFEYGNVHLYTLNISDLVFTWLVNTRRKWKCKWKDSAFRIEWAEVNPKSQNNSSTTHLALPSFSHVWSQLVPRYWPTSFGWHFEKEYESHLNLYWHIFVLISSGVFLRFLFLHIFLLFLFFGLCLW